MKAVLFTGQGAQRRGMGRELFGRYPDVVAAADRILGYGVEQLCLEDPGGELSRTAFTQPAIYVVSRLAYLDFERTHGAPDFVAGHSVGEYAALAAAGVLDFETGLRLVQRRAALMARADGGGLTAIVGVSPAEVEELLARPELSGVEVANFNTPSQTVVGGSAPALEQLERACAETGRRAVRLNVSGAFHTGAMRAASEEFERFLSDFSFSEPKIRVALNLTGALHAGEDLRKVLARHIASPVRWSGCVAALIREGASTFHELPSAGVLTGMTDEIRRSCSSPIAARGRSAAGAAPSMLERRLVAGTLGRGIAGPELVGALAAAGVVAFLDAEDAPLDRLEADLEALLAAPAIASRVGASLAPSIDRQDESRLADLCVRADVQNLELRGYERPTEAVRRYRASASERVVRRIFLRTARPAVIDAFIDAGSPDGHAFAAAICVERGVWRSCDGDPDAALRHALARREDGRRAGAPAGEILIGVAPPSLAPESVRSAFASGCDFVMTGSAMLLADEARLDEAARGAIRVSKVGLVQLLPDGWLPELATRSTAWIGHPDEAENVLALQDRYLRPLAASGQGFRDVRERLREEAAAAFRRPIPCDPSFGEFRDWIVTRPAATGASLTAARIADWIVASSPAMALEEGNRP